MGKVVATYTGRFDVYQKLSNIKIQIISVPKQKNKIVMTGQGSFKNINGSLLSVKKLIHDEKSLGWDLKPTKMYGLSIHYQNRGSHQGGPMHNFKDLIALFSKDEKQIDKLLKFLEKHITKKKVRRTKKKSKRKKKKTQKGGRASADLLTKLQIKNMQRLKQCESKAKNKSQKKKCLNEFNKRWSDYSKFINKKSIRKGRNYADRKQYTPKQQREIIKQFFGKDQKGGGKKYYGIKNNKVIELYPHKIKKSIGRHKYIISWKTTKENLPGKTFHGKFYKSKEEAIKNIK